MNPKKKRYLAMAGRAVKVMRWYDGVLRAEKPPLPVQCKRGCNACCKQFVGVMLPEGAAIVEEHEGLVKSLVPRLREDEALHEKLHAEHDGAPVRIAEAWWKLQRPCPFLSEEGDCRIYDRRPMACRVLNALSDPAQCAEYEPAEVMSWHPQLPEATRRMAVAQDGEHVTIGPMADVVLAALGRV